MSVRVPRDHANSYGCLVGDDQGFMEHYAEKPATFISDTINTGVYCFSPSFFDKVSEFQTLKEQATQE